MGDLLHHISSLIEKYLSIILTLGLLAGLAITTRPAMAGKVFPYGQNTNTLGTAAFETYTFLPQDDTYVLSTYPDNNYGSDVFVNVDNSPVTHILFKFNITGLTGRIVTNATLKVFNTNESRIGGDFYRVPDQNWSEKTVTWNTAPAPDSLLVGSLGTVVAGNWYSLDLTTFITGDGEYSMRVTSTSSNGADYSSKEGANPPVLEITVSNEATPTPGTTTPTLSPTPTYTRTPTLTPTNTFTPAPSATPYGDGTVRFAAVADYGDNSQAEADVATLIKSWNPDFIVTAGDNNYPDGGAATIDGNIGKYYRQYIYPYIGSYGPGGSINRFFPALGNHDWVTPLAQPYFDYFVLPGNERYYTVTYGSVQVFILDSDPHEPDGVTSTSFQGEWLRYQLAISTAVWKVVVFHHAAYTSGYHGSTVDMRWPFKEWGADAVISGHDHTYERLMVDGIPYFVNGLGSTSFYNFGTILPESVVRFTGTPGAMLMDASATTITFRFYTRASELIDEYTVTKSDLPTPTDTITSTATLTPSPTPEFSPTITDTTVPTATFTDTPTKTPVPTLTFTNTASATPLPSTTASPIPSATNTPLPSATSSPVPSATITLTQTSTVTPTHTLTPTPTRTPSSVPSASPIPITPPDLIFSSSFELGTFQDWSSSVIDAGDLSISAAAAQVGKLGMAAIIDDKRTIYVTENSPVLEARYRARFYLHPNGLTQSSTPLTIFSGYMGTSTQLFKVEMRYVPGTFQMRISMRNDGTTWFPSAWAAISNASHFVEIYWLAAAASGANNGEMTLWIDGIQSARLSGIDSDKRRVDLVRLGILSAPDSLTRGTLYFDAFESRRTTPIGPAVP